MLNDGETVKVCERDVAPVREAPFDGVTDTESKTLTVAVWDARFVDETPPLAVNANDDVVVTVSLGDVDALAQRLLEAEPDSVRVNAIDAVG